MPMNVWQIKMGKSSKDVGFFQKPQGKVARTGVELMATQQH